LLGQPKERPVLFDGSYNRKAPFAPWTISMVRQEDELSISNGCNTLVYTEGEAARGGLIELWSVSDHGSCFGFI